ncbi:hypothetical protein ACJJTC_009690 [Scirpophaga incertulas]
MIFLLYLCSTYHYNESTLKEALSETEDVDSISSSSVKGTHSNSKLQSKPHSSFWKRYGQNNLDSQSFSASTINKAKRSEVEFEHFKPPLHNNDDLSSSDDDFDIFPTKNSFFVARRANGDTTNAANADHDRPRGLRGRPRADDPAYEAVQTLRRISHAVAAPLERDHTELNAGDVTAWFTCSPTSQSQPCTPENTKRRAAGNSTEISDAWTTDH